MDIIGDIVSFVVVILIAVFFSRLRKRNKAKKPDFNAADRVKAPADCVIPKKAAEAGWNMEASEEIFVNQAADDEGEYKSGKAYKVKGESYKEMASYKSIDHSKAYVQERDGDELTPLEKGIIFSEILSKPVSMRK